MFIAKLQKKEGNLQYLTEKEKLSYKLFLDTLNEGDEVEIFINRKGKLGSLAQITKVHTCIRILAEEAGLKIGNEYKSFADCDKEELSAAIQTCVEIGNLYNINLA